MKQISLFISLFITFSILAQPYAPAAGEEGSTAIPFDDPSFVSWATNVEVIRGYINIEDTTVYYQDSNKATFGEPENAVGTASNITTDAVSLGDSGIAIVTFNQYITNGPGYDFAVFENGITDEFLELAHVEVSSDGINYVRFPSHSLTQTETPVGSFGSLNPVEIHNLAGKYRVGFGTPFDLEELKDSPMLDVEKITHVKIIDVVGALGEKGTFDSYGNKVNDLFPTPFNTGGFDLNGVGVINERNSLNLQTEAISFSIYPNPSKGKVTIHLNNGALETVRIMNQLGQEIKYFDVLEATSSLQLEIPAGIYIIYVQSNQQIKARKLIIN